MNSVDVLVAGAGFNGIYAAWGLARSGLRVALVDANSTLGGSLRGRHWNGYWLDSGTHNFDLRTALGEEFFLDILRNEAVILEDTDWASTTKCHWSYGFEMPDLSEDYPELATKALAEIKDLIPRCPTVTSESKYITWYEKTYGTTLKHVFTPMMRKFTGTEPADFAVNARQILAIFSRPKLGSDAQMITLKQSAQSWDDRLGVTLRSGDLRFAGKNANKKICYPAHKGTQGFCDAASQRLNELGVDSLLESPVRSIEPTYQGVTVCAGDKRISTRHLLWTLPLPALAKLMGYTNNDAHASTPVGMAIYAFEVDQAVILGPDYLHDFSPNRLPFRYNRTGIYGNQVRSDGRTVVMAEVPAHPAKLTNLLRSKIEEQVWQDMLSTGFLAADAKLYSATSWGLPVVFHIPNTGWHQSNSILEKSVRDESGNIHHIDAGRGRLAFMQYFKTNLKPAFE